MTDPKGKHIATAVPADLTSQTPEERSAFVKEVARWLREGLKPTEPEVKPKKGK